MFKNGAALARFEPRRGKVRVLADRFNID